MAEALWLPELLWVPEALPRSDGSPGATAGGSLEARPPDPDVWALEPAVISELPEARMSTPSIRTIPVDSGPRAAPPPPSPPPDSPASPASAPAVWRVATSVYRGARKVIGDPRVTSVLQAGPNVVSFVARARARSAAAVDDVTVVKTKTTPALVAQAYLDEILLAVFRHPGLLPQAHDYTVAASDVMAFRDLCAQRGWLEDPTAYHRDPLPPDDVVARHERRVVLSYEHTTFTSGWEPHEGEGGRDRWLRHTANRTTHAWVARAPGPDSGSWVVCAHGFGMGTNALMDLQAFRVAQLHRRGINVVVPVLPLHGPRASGRVRGEDFMTIDMVDSVHGIAQAAWDLRRVIRWLRATQGARHVGVIGYSLGGLVASVVGALEDDLACVIAGIPVVDLPQLFRRHMPARMARLAVDEGALGPAADDAHRVVSPLAMSCRVPFERRFVFAGLADRLSTFGQARRLWLHWGQPAFAPYPGGHMGFYWSADVKRFVDEALAASYPAAAA